jgi:O-acetyl-ADP-ribose deacetylase (regulator of RNase III)
MRMVVVLVDILLILDMLSCSIGLITGMAMLEYKAECILKAAHNRDIDYLLHGCNCMKTFGAGFAKKLKEKYPEANKADQSNPLPAYSKIGSYSSCVIGDFCAPDLTIVNLYTQYDYGTTCRKGEYGSIKRSLEMFARDFCTTGKTIGLVKLGCGLAGCSWSVVEHIIEEVADTVNGRWIVYTGEV